MPHVFYFHELTCGRFLRYARVPLTRQCKKKEEEEEAESCKKRVPRTTFNLEARKILHTLTHPHMKKNTSAISKAVKAVGEKIGPYFRGRHHRERVAPEMTIPPSLLLTFAPPKFSWGAKNPLLSRPFSAK